MLSWQCLGVLLHGVMRRLWASGVVDLGPMVAAGDGLDGSNLSSEDAFRLKRSKWAKRVLLWMQDYRAQMRSTTTLLVTEGLASTMGDYLQSEYMYAADRVHDAEADRPWMPSPHTGHRDIPTLFDFMSNDRATLRSIGSSVVGVLTSDDGGTHFVAKSFPTLALEDVGGIASTHSGDRSGLIYALHRCLWRTAF